MTQLIVSVKDDKNASIIKELLKDLSFIDKIQEINSVEEELTSEEQLENVKKHILELKSQHKDMSVKVDWKG
ncbi:hypothetical protein [Flammeovirga sp. SJP92]|uniref:hypothetical protein n=1 Tax=Flammeovirga sp. SJP92 TaxID=1775430 RepID=UPI00078882A4|nr:hypothetical protein [Flammeovirga sp. SJP92]KXX67225.1 hypothetical protein AVL50_27960 [Flammeovirga sp. SJP92]